LVKGGAEDIKEALWPLNAQQDHQNSPDLRQNEIDLEKSYRSQVRRSESLRHEEKVLFSREQKETQVKVEALQEEIKSLAKAVGELAGQAKEAEISVSQNLPEVGKYHLNFFEKIRKAIAELRAQIQESSLWLEAWNKKSQKKNHYWNQFKKSGSKFLLSSDRYMATQAG
jgi:seryl-tRNA synthetase